MNILVIADEELKSLWDYYDATRIGDIDLIISCGDLNPRYLEFLVSMTNVPLLYVPGNHDTRYVQHPPEGCINIDEKVYNFHGLRIMGIGGSMKYNTGAYQYTEEEMKKRLNKMKTRVAITGGFDIMVTHSPCAGYGDMEDLPHRGFECFNAFLDRYKPKYMLHGHVHKSYGAMEFQRIRTHGSGTKLINAFERYDLEVSPDEYPAQGKTGSGFYDLYISLQQKFKRSY